MFVNNSAIDGGAIYGIEGTFVKDIRGIYKNNNASNKGGAIYLTVNPEVYSLYTTCDSNYANDSSCLYVAHTE